MSDSLQWREHTRKDEIKLGYRGSRFSRFKEGRRCIYRCPYCKVLKNTIIEFRKHTNKCKELQEGEEYE